MAQLLFNIIGKDEASGVLANVASKAEGLAAPFMKVAGFATAALAPIAGFEALKSVGSIGLSTAANMEQANIAFTTMLGSGQKAQAFLGDLSKFAAATPFDMPGLTTAASSLISAGVDASHVIPIMNSLGNATSGMGTGSEGIQRATVALQQMNAAQKISAEDLNQLRDAGIPVYDLLSAATGKSKQQVVELAQSGKLGKQELDQLMAALAEGKGLERFNGLMEKQSQSLTGLVSTFKDTFAMGMANALQPLIPIIKDGLVVATDMLGKVLPVVSKHLAEAVSWATAFGNSFKTGMYESGNAAQHLGAMASGAFSKVATVIADVKDGVGAFVAVWNGVDSGQSSAGGIIGLFAKVAEVARPTFDAIKAAVGDLAPSFVAIIPQVLGLVTAFSPLHLIFSAIAPLLPDIVGLIAQLASAFGSGLATILPPITDLMGSLVDILSQAFVSLLPAATSIIGAVVAAFGVLAPVIGQVVSAVAPLITALLGALIPIIVELVNTILPPVIDIFMNIVQAIVPLVSMILAILIPVIQALMPVVTTVFQVIAAIITAAMQVVQGIIQVVTGIITGNWDHVWHGILNILQGVWNVILAVVQGAINIVVSVISAAVGLVSGVWNGAWSAISGFLGGVWNNIVNAVSDGIGNVIGFVGGIQGRILGALGAVGQWLWDVGVNIIQGLINGAKSMVDSAVQAVKNVGGAMLDGIKNFLGIKSPSVEAHKLGQFFGLGLIGGLDASHSGIRGAMDRMGGLLAGGFDGQDLGLTASANLAVAGASPVVHVYVGNEQLDARTYRIAGQAIDGADWRAGQRGAR